MSEFFLKIVNMSISASWIVLAVVLLRFLLKKAPRWITVLLWGIVAIRLICPFSIESALSLIPSAETIRPEIMMDQTPEIDTGVPILNETINPVIRDSFASNPDRSANPLQIWIPILSLVWILGIVLLLTHTIISYWRIRRKVRTAVLLRENIYQSESVVSPFVLGIIKPKIYLPFPISAQDMEHVIAHEKSHIKRKDPLWKPFGFFLLTIHWFNPFLWLGYTLLCRDIELACDEKVVKGLNHEQKADYSQALLTCSVNRRMIAACPLAFGEVGVKDRVKSVLNYKKPAFWIIMVAILSCVVAAVCFLTDPISIDDKTLFSEKNDLLISVLKSETKYMDESGKEVYLKDYKIPGDSNTFPEKHTWVDFDSDGQEELVVHVTWDYGPYLVFHIENDRVLGFQFEERWMMNLKKDGTFRASEGAGLHFYYSLKFENSTYETRELAYIDDVLKEFRLNGENATEEEAASFYNDFCKKKDVRWSWNNYETVVTDPRQLYMQFLNEETAARDNGQSKFLKEYLLNDFYGKQFSYTFYDMTGDGIVELCIKRYPELFFFTVKDGYLYHWCTEGTAYTDLLRNGALFYERHGAAPTHIYYEYYELDENASVSFRITFSWWDGSTVEEGKVYPDFYEINGQEVTKEEYEEKTRKYLELGKNKITWINQDGYYLQ